MINQHVAYMLRYRRRMIMAKIGLTVHEIRINKGLTQKEVYAGIVSRSFANRFEKGLNDISASKLFSILDNLAVSLDEFRFISQNYQSAPYDQALLFITQKYAAQDFMAISEWVHTHEKSPYSYDKLVSSYATILLTTYENVTVGITPATYDIYQHLQSTPMWTTQELKVVNVIIPMVATTSGIKALDEFTVKMEENCGRYQTDLGDPFNVLNSLIEFYGVLMQTYLNFEDYQRATKIGSKLTAIGAKKMNWDGILAKQFWLGIWELYFGDWLKGNQLLDEVINLEKRQSPRIDNTLLTIYKVRLKAATKYRQKRT
ncbi:helix-turn-helix domain-containing protein [Pediococcus stilesii]|nr:helix-turn-helix transcriptional regulator [Pediococcus stilesii]